MAGTEFVFAEALFGLYRKEGSCAGTSGEFNVSVVGKQATVEVLGKDLSVDGIARQFDCDLEDEISSDNFYIDGNAINFELSNTGSAVLNFLDYVASYNCEQRNPQDTDDEELYIKWVLDDTMEFHISKTKIMMGNFDFKVQHDDPGLISYIETELVKEMSIHGFIVEFKKKENDTLLFSVVLNLSDEYYSNIYPKFFEVLQERVNHIINNYKPKVTLAVSLPPARPIISGKFSAIRTSATPSSAFPLKIVLAGETKGRVIAAASAASAAEPRPAKAEKMEKTGKQYFPGLLEKEKYPDPMGKLNKETMTCGCWPDNSIHSH